MKRALVLGLVCILGLSLTASASWKFGAEQEVDVIGGLYPLGAYFGFDFDAPFIDMTALSIAGDFVLTRADLWPWGALSGITMVDAELVFSFKKSMDVVLSMGGEIDYKPLPRGLLLLDWLGGVEVVGYVNSVLTLNAGLDLQYRFGPQAFATTFFFGFDAAW